MIELVPSTLDCYCPGDSLSVADLLTHVELTTLPTGFQRIADYQLFAESVLNTKAVVIEKDLDEGGMLGELLDKLFLTEIVRPAEVDLVIMAKEAKTDFNYRHNLGQALLHQYGMTNAYVLNVSGNHCANAEVALGLADHLLKGSTSLSNILILTCTKTEHPADRIIGTYGILGDGAGLLLRRRSGNAFQLIDQEICCNPALHIIDLNKDNSLWHAKYQSKCISTLLRRNRVEVGCIRKIVIQNANPLLIMHSLNEIGLTPEKVFDDNFGRYGHLDSVDFILNLKDLLNSGEVNSGEWVLTFNMGWAGTYICSLLSIH